MMFEYLVVVYIVHDANVKIYFYIASDILKKVKKSPFPHQIKSTIVPFSFSRSLFGSPFSGFVMGDPHYI